MQWSQTRSFDKHRKTILLSYTGDGGYRVPDFMYNVLALIPDTTDFTIDKAVAYFSQQTFSKVKSDKIIYQRHPLRAELAVSEGNMTLGGFRVYFGDWAVVAWLEAGRTVEGESEELSGLDDLPAPSKVVASCTRRLSVWSDEDPSFFWTDDFTEYTCFLREQFGMLIYDCVNGCWWT